MSFKEGSSIQQVSMTMSIYYVPSHLQFRLLSVSLLSSKELFEGGSKASVSFIPLNLLCSKGVRGATKSPSSLLCSFHFSWGRRQQVRKGSSVLSSVSTCNTGSARDWFSVSHSAYQAVWFLQYTT